MKAAAEAEVAAKGEIAPTISTCMREQVESE